jgi:hypothetical protein
MNRCILDLLNKFITPGHFRFPLTNPHKGPSLHFVPKSNPANILILFHICSANLNSASPFSQKVRKSFRFGFWQALLAGF